MISKVILTPSDKVLTGRFYHENETVIVLLDTTDGGFVVQLPDVRANGNVTITFKNIGTNTATITPSVGQYIDNVTTINVLTWENLTIWPDIDKRWIII